MAKLICPQEACGSNDSWATYICAKGGSTDTPGSHTRPLEWSEEAIGPKPDGVPNNRPCPGCSNTTRPSYASCASCGYSWTWNSEGEPIPR